MNFIIINRSSSNTSLLFCMNFLCFVVGIQEALAWNNAHCVQKP